MTTMFMSNLVAGDIVLAGNSLYGGTFEFLNHFIPSFGIKAIFADFRNINAVEDILRNNPASINYFTIETSIEPDNAMCEYCRSGTTGKKI